jgi:hypothetical protein
MEISDRLTIREPIGTFDSHTFGNLYIDDIDTGCRRLDNSGNLSRVSTEMSTSGQCCALGTKDSLWRLEKLGRILVKVVRLHRFRDHCGRPVDTVSVRNKGVRRELLTNL